MDPDPLARADREQDLGAWLSRHGVGGAWRLAPPLAAAGVDPAWCARAEAIVGGSSLEPALEWVASTFSVATLLAELKESTRRISELVAAMRSYSQLDRASLQKIEVADGLETTLVMLSHKLGGITVERDFGADVPPIEAYAGELNQVWTNLIDNAIDAMDGEGTLRVATRNAEDGVVVEIADTGSGMPPEVAAHAFEAFYTTKDVGKGTGLGLDIARRIVVERHGGTITIDSQPGRTVLRIQLPLRPEPRGLSASRYRRPFALARRTRTVPITADSGHVCAHNGPIRHAPQLKPATACGSYGCSRRATSSSVSSIWRAAIASSR